MFIKKCLPLTALVLLLSNVVMQGMDITVRDDGWTTRGLKEYNAFVDALKHEKYIINNDKWAKLSLNGLVELAVYSPDIRYLKKLMEYPVYASFIKSKGLALFDYVENEHTKNVKLLLDAGVDVNKVISEKKADDQQTPSWVTTVVNSIKLWVAVETDNNEMIRKSEESSDRETLLWQAVLDCCGGGGMLTVKESDKIVKLLIKRGANVAIKFSDHDTLLQGVESQIALESKGSKDTDDIKKINEMSKVRDLLANASQIRADYLKKQAKKM